VNIELESADVIHSFWVPSLHGKVDLVPHWTNYIRIEADHPGDFSGTCAEFCGAQHAHMGLTVIAQPPDEYDAWLDGQRKPAALPQGEEAQRGATLFQSGPCANCHMIRGTLAGGTVAPDLTHLASRGTIAAHSFPNDTAHLAAWVTHAQSLKPKNQMPDITQFNGQQLRDLVAYLQQLK
jgi:cytochrome c oxidase subunit 2